MVAILGSQHLINHERLVRLRFSSNDLSGQVSVGQLVLFSIKWHQPIKFKSNKKGLVYPKQSTLLCGSHKTKSENVEVDPRSNLRL